MSGDGGVERGRQDPLVLGEQVVGELVEVADAADHRRRRDDLIALGGEFAHEPDVLGITLHEPVARVAVVRLRQRPVLAEVVEPDHVVTRFEQFGNEIAVDEPGRAGDEDPH